MYEGKFLLLGKNQFVEEDFVNCEKVLDDVSKSSIEPDQNGSQNPCENKIPIQKMMAGSPQEMAPNINLNQNSGIVRGNWLELGRTSA